MQTVRFEDIRDYPKYWAYDLTPAPFLPMSKKEMDLLGWDSCDIIIVTGDAYIDHPSFCTAIVGRYLESFGYRVGVISQPDWHSKDAFMELGRPNLFFGVNAGNMDSMINHYTADKKIRTDDAYTPNNIAGKRPDRAVTVYSQRIREAYKDIPVIIGGIEASLRRIAHYDYWSDTVKNSVLADSKADILVYGNGERPLAEIAYRLSLGESVKTIQDVRGTAVMVKDALPEWFGIDERSVDHSAVITPLPKINPYCVGCSQLDERINYQEKSKPKVKTHDLEYIILPSAEKVKQNNLLYAHAARIFIQETNPECARALMQKHGERYVWVNPPTGVLTTEELDYVYALPFKRIPHPIYNGQEIPAYEMIKNSVSIMRGCFGGCSFCSIVAHEGKRIQSRSQESILTELSEISEKTPGFTGVISDLGGPSANMYMLGCTNENARKVCRKPSCLYPEPCKYLNTDHSKLIELYRAARSLPFIKKILVASGVRIDLALLDKRYIKELVMYHVGGYLKIAPEHTVESVLRYMLKPNTSVYYKFKELFESYSSSASKKQYLIPYFMASHPGSTLESMVKLSLWLKKNDFKVDQVQNFYPTPMAGASTMYYTGINPYEEITSKTVPSIFSAKGEISRRTQKAILRYHDSANYKVIRDVLLELKLDHLIGRTKDCLVPPAERGEYTKKYVNTNFRMKNKVDTNKRSKKK
ncbi:MAG: YgiQ family radical SAM protein [Succinivibrionaceae bacterium]